MRFSVFSALVLVLVQQAFAQPLRVHHLESGQEMSAVRSMWRDHLGYLWIGNLGLGLMRYDGTEVVRYVYDESDPTSLTSDFVTRVFEDSKERLWVATLGGLCRYERRFDNFVRFETAENNSVVDLYEDEAGRLWALSPNSIALFDEASGRFDSHELVQGEKGGSGFTSLVEGAEGQLWIASSGTELWRVDGESMESESFEILPGGSGSTKRFYKDLSGRLWLAARDDGLFEFYPDRLEVKHYGMDLTGAGTSGSNVSDALEYPKGRLMIAVDQGGLNFLDKETGRFSYQRVHDGTGNGLTSDGLISFHHDDEGIIWIGSSRTGVDFFNPKMERFSTLRKGGRNSAFDLPASVVGCVYEDAKGRVWIGTGGGGLGWKDPETGQLTWIPKSSEEGALLKSDVVRQVDEGSDGRIWVGTWNGGVDALIEENGTFRLDTRVSERLAELDSISIWDIEMDARDRLWVCAAKGDVFLYSDEGELLKYFGEALNEGIVAYSPIVNELENGEIILTTERALYRLNEDTLSFEELIRMSKPTVVAWSEDRAVYYVGTIDQGVLVLDRKGKEVGRVGTEEGLGSLFVRSLEVDFEGDLWMGTNDGLYHYKMASGELTRYDVDDGLQGNLYFTNSSCRTREGRLYFGGTKGVSSLMPEEVEANDYLPHVSVDRISLFGEALDFGEEESIISVHPQAVEELHLNWQQNFLKFEFSAVNMTYPENNRFAYILEGFDPGWIYGDANLRWANYTNVDPGEYVFRVKAANNDGVWNQEARSIRVVVTPPFWQQIWFYVLVFISLVAAVSLYILVRERRLRLENDRLEKGVKERTKVISDQKERLAEKTEQLEEQKEELESQKTELEAQQGQLLMHQNHLEDMISERTKELVLARDKAESANRLKSQFLANLSHEVRTPLNAITGFASFLQDELDEESRHEFVGIIEENSDSLLNLIEGILDYSLLASREMELYPRRFELNTFILKLEEAYRKEFEDKGLSFTVDNTLQDFDLCFDYDEERLSQIAEQLLSNALKFTEKGGACLSVGLKGSDFCLSVSDTGHGIFEEDQDKVFEQFVRLAEDEKAARRGLGLGLAIAKSLAELMGGSLSLMSEYGKGALFTLTIPCEEEVAISKRRNPNAQNGSREKKKPEDATRVLVVEDEEANFKYLEIALKSVNCEVVWAEDGIRAVETLKRDVAFDVVLLDLRMPGLDGYSVLEWIREHVPGLRVVAQTAYATKIDEARIKSAGFDDYLPKPIVYEKLRQLIRSVRGGG